MIPHLKNIPYEERLAILKLWSLEDRRVRADLIEVYKITHGYSSVTIDTFFEIDPTSRTRGHPWKLKKKRSNTDLRHHFFSDLLINWWNKLDHDGVCATSVNAFKIRLQRVWESDDFVFRPYSNKLQRSYQAVTGVASSGKHIRIIAGGGAPPQTPLGELTTLPRSPSRTPDSLRLWRSHPTSRIAVPKLWSP